MLRDFGMQELSRFPCDEFRFPVDHSEMFKVPQN
jgi:hypothetical protein